MTAGHGQAQVTVPGTRCFLNLPAVHGMVNSLQAPLITFAVCTACFRMFRRTCLDMDIIQCWYGARSYRTRRRRTFEMRFTYFDKLQDRHRVEVTIKNSYPLLRPSQSVPRRRKRRTISCYQIPTATGCRSYHLLFPHRFPPLPCPRKCYCRCLVTHHRDMEAS